MYNKRATFANKTKISGKKKNNFYLFFRNKNFLFLPVTKTLSGALPSKSIAKKILRALILNLTIILLKIDVETIG